MNVQTHDEQRPVIDALKGGDLDATAIAKVTGMSIRKLRRILADMRKESRIFIAAYSSPKTGYPSAIYRAGRGMDATRSGMSAIKPRSAYSDDNSTAFMSLVCIEAAISRPHAAAH